MSKQNGFAALELVMVAVALSLIGYVGYAAFNNAHRTASVNSPVGSHAMVAPQVTKTADLTAAAAALDATDVDGTSDTTQLDSDLKAF